MLPLVSGEFRAVTDSTLRFTPTGMAVAEFRAVADKKKKNEATGEWEDDKICWITVTCFRKLAENVAESVTKGTLVEVIGYLQTEDWETKEGEKRTTIRVIANRVSLSMAFNPAKSLTSERAAAPAEDPWSGAPVAGDGDAPSDPPF